MVILDFIKFFDINDIKEEYLNFKVKLLGNFFF